MSSNSKKVITIKELENEQGATGTRSDYKDHTDPKYIGPVLGILSTEEVTMPEPTNNNCNSSNL